jgi:hypothetical protein
MLMLCLFASRVEALQREDVLECELQDGSKFILRSTYDWSAIPLPMGHSKRESNRSAWNVAYLGRHGREVAVPASVDYKGESRLQEACAHMGMKGGVPLAPFSFLQADGNWSAQEGFPMERLNISHFSLQEGSPVQQELQRAGIKGDAFNFGWIYATGLGLVYEKPLYGKSDGYLYTRPIAAVYQAWSKDGGKTWSEGRVMNEATIFELGRGWVEQGIRARPRRLNGKALPP